MDPERQPETSDYVNMLEIITRHDVLAEFEIVNHFLNENPDIDVNQICELENRLDDKIGLEYIDQPCVVSGFLYRDAPDRDSPTEIVNLDNAELTYNCVAIQEVDGGLQAMLKFYIESDGTDQDADGTFMQGVGAETRYLCSIENLGKFDLEQLFDLADTADYESRIAKKAIDQTEFFKLPVDAQIKILADISQKFEESLGIQRGETIDVEVTSYYPLIDGLSIRNLITYGFDQHEVLGNLQEELIDNQAAQAAIEEWRLVSGIYEGSEYPESQIVSDGGFDNERDFVIGNMKPSLRLRNSASGVTIYIPADSVVDIFDN